MQEVASPVRWKRLRCGVEVAKTDASKLAAQMSEVVTVAV